MRAFMHLKERPKKRGINGKVREGRSVPELSGMFARHRGPRTTVKEEIRVGNGCVNRESKIRRAAAGIAIDEINSHFSYGRH